MCSTARRVPLTTGLPVNIAGSITTRVCQSNRTSRVRFYFTTKTPAKPTRGRGLPRGPPPRTPRAGAPRGGGSHRNGGAPVGRSTSGVRRRESDLSALRQLVHDVHDPGDVE